MRTVVDTSVVAKWYFDEPGCADADRLLAEAMAGERDLLAPDLQAAEFASVLLKKIRRGSCDRESAEAILDLWANGRPEFVPSVELVGLSLALAVEHDHSVYGCLYLAAAIEWEASFVTADHALAELARSVLPVVERIG